MLTHYNLVAVTRQGEPFVADVDGWRTVGVLPFFHIYGLVVLMNYPIYFGGLCVTLPRFDLAEFLRIVQDHRITHLYLVPPIVLALARTSPRSRSSTPARRRSTARSSAPAPSAWAAS